MEDKIQQEKGWSIWILILLVVLFCGYGIVKAYEQRSNRLNWERSVEGRFYNINEGVKQNTQAISVLQNAHNQQQSDINILYQKIQQPVSQPAYEYYAGCYGVLPQENVTTFSLQCSREFFVN
jgi:hypothetical protein